jgi:hypothetical protein
MSEFQERAAALAAREEAAGGPEALVKSLVRGQAQQDEILRKQRSETRILSVVLAFGVVLLLAVGVLSGVAIANADRSLNNQTQIRKNEDGLKQTDFRSAVHEWEDCQDYSRAIGIILATHEQIMGYLAATDPPSPALKALLASDQQYRRPSCGPKPVEAK